MGDQDASDIGRAWEDALDKYCKDTGTNMKYLPQMKWNVSAIISEQERQVETFNKYRHNKGMTDKLRSLISRNSAVIQSVANNIANSASSAFPPSAAILTAFTYIMKASKNVSDDYDQVAAFFEIMGSLMERLSLLETKLPSAKNYKTILMRVFTSLMGLCGTATKYVTEGRFKHWLKALYKGTDDEIKGEYTKLETNINRLESATMFATLATVMETKTDVKDLTAISMQSLKVGTQTLAVSSQNLSVSIETQTMVGGMALKQDETLSAIKKFERKMLASQESKKEEKESSKGKSKDSGAKKNAALNLVKTTFATQAEPAIQLKEIQTSFVEGTLSWVDEEEGFKTFMDGDSPFLWIYGPPGIGKSCMAYNIIGKFLKSTENDARSSVAYYFFREEHEELRSARNMLCASVIQAAIGDGKYRDEVAAELKVRGTNLGEGLDGIWTRFFVDRYPKDADQRLIIVLDGLDEAEKEDRDQILELLKRIKKEELSIQVVFTSRVVKEIEGAMGELHPSRVEITKEQISKRGGDLWKIIMKRCKTYSKLKRLQKPALRKIGTKLRLKADSVLYVEHMLRRLNVLGRESLIFKELDKLPEDLPKLYEMLLAECQKDRSKDQLSALKKLFAWLAYSKRPLTLGEANSLIKVVPGTKSFSIEEEIDGRSARILNLATEVADDGSSAEESDSELNEKLSDEETSNNSLDNSIISPLKFQERSMRQYFRAMEVDENGLRSSPSQGHFTIFEMAARIMNTSEDTDEKGDDTTWQLRHYAVNFWMQHFLDIELESTSDEEVQTVISSLYMIMNPEGEGLRNIEWFSYGEERKTFFGPTPYPLRDRFFKRFFAWLERGANIRRMTTIEFGDDVARWMQTCASEEETLVHLAKAHVINWYRADRTYKARFSFECARSTLRMTGIDHGLTNDSGPDNISDDEIMAVANVFPEIEKDGHAYLAIGMTFYSYRLFTELLKQPLNPFQKSLEMASNDAEKYFRLFWVGQFELDLSATLDDDEEEKMRHVRNSYDAILASINLYHEKEEVRAFIETTDRQDIHQINITYRARCEIKLNEIDKALATMDEAYAVLGDDVDSSLDTNFVADITAYLDKEGDFEKLIAVVGQFKKWDLVSWIGFQSSTGHDRFQRAAWECKKQDFMIKTYENMINEVDKFNSGAHIRGQLATVYQYVFPDYEAAKKLLYEVMDGKKGTSFRDADQEFIFETRLQLSDILMEQFRASADANLKMSLLGEMKNVAIQRNVGLFFDFNPFESQTVISLALMTGKMGPTAEFHTMMDRTFRGCIDALTDTHAWNDSQGFRLLAKVLAFVPEMRRDAQIAFSLQFSAVDEKLFKPEETEDTTAVVTNGDATATEKIVPVLETSEAPAQTEMASEAVQDPATVTEDLNPNSEIYCNGCSNHFSTWAEGAVYGCIICTNCDLCESCWKKMDRHNKGEPWKEWKSYCGFNHKYIKGPIAGWNGVKDGILRIENVGEGEAEGSKLMNGAVKPAQVEEIKFDDWLDGVQEHWGEAWRTFWKKEDLVVDIL